MAKKGERRPGPVELVLIRHGQGEDEARGLHGGWLDLPSTPLGLRQAEALADRLRRDGFTFDALYTSPLVRAMETARAVGTSLNLEPRPDDGLRPRARGDITGLTFEEAERRYPGAWGRTWSTHERAVPGAETPAEFATRTYRALDRISLAHEGGRIAVVTHGSVVRGAVRRCFDARPWAGPGVILNCDPASITHLRITADGLHQIVTLNDRAHLAALRE